MKEDTDEQRKREKTKQERKRKRTRNSKKEGTAEDTEETREGVEGKIVGRAKEETKS